MARPDLTEFVIALEKDWKSIGVTTERTMGIRDGTSLAYTVIGTSPEMIHPTKVVSSLRRTGKMMGMTLRCEKEGTWELAGKGDQEEMVLWEATLTVALARANLTIVDRHIDPKTPPKKLHSRQRKERRWA